MKFRPSASEVAQHIASRAFDRHQSEQPEDEGLLINQGGRRRRRQIELPENQSPPAHRIALLMFNAEEQGEDLNIEL
ncbi:hypothetical protein OAL00_00030 [Verrucomicrobiales bacterium]|nr:hypothetical protein [Verrucomicrobiales bacterium]